MAVGNALLTIRDSKLYREQHRTFKDYCAEKWGIGKSYASYLISGSKVAANLLTQNVHCGGQLYTPCEIQPIHEKQVRPLSQLEPPQQCEVWEAAVRSSDGKVVTYKQVKDAVTELIGPGPGAKIAVCFSLGIRLFLAPTASAFCPTDPNYLGALFAGRGGAVVALRSVDLSSRGEGLGAHLRLPVLPAGKVGQGKGDGVTQNFWRQQRALPHLCPRSDSEPSLLGAGLSPPQSI